MENKNLRIVFYFLWTAMLLVQSLFVELRGDEAYYWMYAKALAWGYFDHPPVTAVLVKAGYLLFHNEMGVRLFFVLSISGMIWVMERLIQPANLKMYYAIVISIAFLQLGMVFGGGMFAIPDFPLLFFTALFFYLYKQYLQDDSWMVVFGLSAVMCLLLLSKYHGILIIGFTLLSNLALLKRKSFWVMTALSILLFTPHLLWQLENNFPSMHYHFFERSNKGYSMAYTTEYLVAQPFILGPFISVVLIYLGITCKPKDLYERSMKLVIVGTYVFFFFMTFKGRVEGNWTVITLVPLLYIGYNRIIESEKLTRVTYYLFGISLLLILTVRILLITYSLPASLSISKSLSARIWTKELKEKSNGQPVAFLNSYQRASQYEFYTGIPAFSFNTIWGRKNQYSLWDTEASFQGKPVTIMSNWPDGRYDSIQFGAEYFPYYFMDDFRSFSNVIIQADIKNDIRVKPRDTLTIQVDFHFRNANSRNLEANAMYPAYLNYSFFQYASSIEMRTGFIIKNSMINSSEFYPVDVIMPELPGKYDFYLSVQTDMLPPGINSEKVKVIVE